MYGSTVKELDAKIKSAINELDYGVNNKELFGNFLRDWLFMFIVETLSHLLKKDMKVSIEIMLRIVTYPVSN